jgi:hypothetical protein
MPFKSKAQMRYMFANHPEIAKRWSKEYKTPKNLPERVKKRTKKAESYLEADMTFEEKVVDAINLATSALEKADQMYQEKVSIDKKIREIVPRIVDSMVQCGLVDHTEKEAADRALRDPVKALKIFERVIAHRENGNKGNGVASMGKPYSHNGTKKASQTIGNGFRVTKTDADSEADRAFFRALGLDNFA